MLKINHLLLILLSVFRQVNKWQLTHNETRALIPIILDQLAESNTKLTDMQEVLDQAVAHIRQTELTNTENTVKLQNKEVLCSVYVCATYL